MSSVLHVTTACVNKGAFGVGTGGQGPSDFMDSVCVPKNPVTGAILPGYTLQSSTSSNTGLDWNFTGANGQTITRYQYPSNCPVPFPTPEQIPADMVLITREDAVTAESGIVDLYMPVLGIQGNVPRHTLPSICDVANQIVFYFDDANSSINVYNVRTRSWRMGWLRALGLSDFSWRAADVLTQPKLNTTYLAPYNVQGIFFSCASTTFVNSIFERYQVNPNVVPGFYFIPYTVDANGNIEPWDTANFFVPTLNLWTLDLNVVAICVVNCDDAAFKTPGTPNTVRDIVVALAVSENSSLCAATQNDPNYAWWGFLGRLTAPGNDPRLLNPDLSPATDSATALPFSIRDLANLATGAVLTISLDESTRNFFLGGNFSNIRFSNAIVERVITPPNQPQKAAVAIQYSYNTTAPMTAANYIFLGQNGNTATTVKDWTGVVTQSNFADGFFGYGGNFRTPPSTVTTTSEGGLNPTTTTFVATPPVQNGLAPVPYARVVVPQEAKGGYLTTVEILFNNNPNSAFLDDGSIYGTNNFALAFIPDDGDLRQSTFPPSIIGGNFLQPTFFTLGNSFKAQTQAPIIASDWWLSTIEIFVGTAIPDGMVTVNAYLYPDNVFNKLQAPLSWTSGPRGFVAGRNYLNVYGAGTANLTGALLNSNLTRSSNFDVGQISNVAGAGPYTADLTVVGDVSTVVVGSTITATNDTGTLGANAVVTAVAGNTISYTASTSPAVGDINNITIQGNLGLYTTPRTWFLELEFLNATASAPYPVEIGQNNLNQKLYSTCWTLRGYVSSDITLTNAGNGFFSSVALQLAAPAKGNATQNAPGANRRIVTFNNLNISVPQSIINYNVFIIPLNFIYNFPRYAVTSLDPAIFTTGAIARLTFTEDRQGDFAFSCLHQPRNPTVVYEVPSMATSDAVTPALSFRLNNRYEIYKSAWANSDRVALGLYTNFQEISDLQFTFVQDATDITGIPNAGKATFNDANTLVLNTYISATQAPPNYAAILKVGDTILIASAAAPLTTSIYRVNNVAQQAAPNYIATIGVTIISPGFSASRPINALVDFILSRNPRQTPFVLKDNFGPYLIGNGSSSVLRDVYLSSFDATGKAYRYIPDYQSSFLSFVSNVFVGGPTVDDTILADTVLFNTNSSSILLTKAADTLGGSQFWNVANVSGNIGFNNQRA